MGLILRETPHQGRRWCLVGGRLLRNEALSEGVARQLYETLGNDIDFNIDPGLQPTYVAQYFTLLRDDGGLDPRQHAVGLTFCVPISGTVRACGEALSFTWFDRDNLPNAGEFGFNQDRVVARCLAHSGLELTLE